MYSKRNTEFAMYSCLLAGGPDDAATYRLASPLIGSRIVLQSNESEMGIIEVYALTLQLYFENQNISFMYGY